MLEHLQKEHEWFEGVMENSEFGMEVQSATSPAFRPGKPRELHDPLHDIFSSFLREAKLVRTYCNLYDQRTKIGVSEGFAMVNQRDAEVNIRMAMESTRIARASHQDSRALRVIQILSMLFLPASLVSSIFGMGFFTTSHGRDGRPVLLVSGGWWLYIAISIPLTAICLFFLGGYNVVHKLRARRGGPPDLEKADSESAKER